VSKLPLHFTLKATHPFGLTPSALALEPGEAGAVTVTFDPNYRGDQTSHSLKQRCLISYPDNPQKDWLDLSGVIEFPNLVFDTQAVDFGCVLMDSMKRMAVQVTNPGTRPVRFSWSWLKQAAPELQDTAGPRE
jgi:hydrocephalus-inducing protein